jgi:hypothetical protein
MQLFTASCYSHLLGSKYFPQHPVLNHLQLDSFPYKTTGTMYEVTTYKNDKVVSSSSNKISVAPKSVPAHNI